MILFVISIVLLLTLFTLFTEPGVGKAQAGKLEESAAGSAVTFILCRPAQQL